MSKKRLLITFHLSQTIQPAGLLSIESYHGLSVTSRKAEQILQSQTHKDARATKQLNWWRPSKTQDIEMNVTDRDYSTKPIRAVENGRKKEEI